MNLGDNVYVVIRRTPRMYTVDEGRYLDTSKSENSPIVAWVDDSGLVSYAEKGDVFATHAEAKDRARVSMEGGK